MRVRNILSIYTFLVLVVTETSCKKFLEVKSNQTLSTPQTLEDLQLLLDNPELTTGMNFTNTLSDEYYLNYNDWLGSIATDQKQGYIWDPQLDDFSDWFILYKIVFTANTALFNLETINAGSNQELFNKVKGMALFLRAHSFYQLAQLYAPQYDAVTANSDFGIPLRLNADFNEVSVRSSVQETYDQIIKDLEEAVALSPASQIYKHRPGKATCFALLARTYLQMGLYSKAKEAADNSLQYNSNLVDYNTKIPSDAFPMGDFNANVEILYYNRITISIARNPNFSKVDSVLYSFFGVNDLRKQIYFGLNTDGSRRFKGHYTGNSGAFNGIAVDEVFLMRAECNARLGNLNAALADLNSLLVKRWATNTFVPITATTADQALVLILQERRKELYLRALRWPDIRRLNKDPRFAIIIKRNLNGQLYELPPNDLRYTLLIPQAILNVVNIPQNPR